MASVYTQADLVAVKNAIIALATGAREASVTYTNGAARGVTYVPAQLNELRALQAEIQREINGSPTFRRAAFSKGFNTNNGGNQNI